MFFLQGRLRKQLVFTFPLHNWPLLIILRIFRMNVSVFDDIPKDAGISADERVIQFEYQEWCQNLLEVKFA